MNTLDKWFNVPPIPGFDCIKEGRRWKREVMQETAGMSDKEVVAYFAKCHKEYAARQRARQRAKRVLAHA